MAMAAIAVLSSCTKEEESNANLNDSGAFYATIEDGSTRTTLDGNNKVLWSEGDKININGTEYTLNDGDGTTHATFTGESVSGETFKAYYPASLYNGTTATLPATQEYDATINGISNLPMYAESTTHDLKFANLCGVLAITVTSDDITTLKSIRVSSSNHDMYGAFTVTDNNAVLSSDAGGNKKVELVSANALTLTSEGTTFYIAIPATSYDMLKIELSVDGTNYTSSMTTQTTSAIAVNRNTIYSFDYDDNKSTAKRGFADATIGGQQVPVEWVQLWANGPKWATINVGQTVMDYSEVTAESNQYTTANVGGLYSWGGTNERREGTTTDDHNSANANLTNTNNTAYKLWGSNWCMPTNDNFSQLKNNNASNNTTWVWCDGTNTQYVTGCTLAGWKVSGKTGTYTDNSIFLPAAGYFYNSSLNNVGSQGRYWNSTNYDNSTTNANYLCFISTNYRYEGDVNRSNGYSVRAVLAE